MANDLALIEQQLRPLTPHFAEALKGSGLAPEKLMRTVLVSLERTPALLGCDRSSIIQAAMTAAVLGLEASGPLGQFYMVPFKGRATPIVGYRGFATIAGRSGFTINGNVVREGDFFEYELGSEGYVRHRPTLGAGRDRRIIGAWATASRPGHAPIVQVLDIDDILFIKSRSPGAKTSDSPWRDPEIGFPAMAAKSAIRRLARTMPINLMTVAAALDEAVEERGKHAWISPEKGLVVEGEAQDLAPAQPGGGPSPASIEKRKFIIHKEKQSVASSSIEEWRGRMEMAIANIRTLAYLDRFRELNEIVMDDYRDEFPEHVNAVGAAFEKRRKEL